MYLHPLPFCPALSPLHLFPLPLSLSSLFSITYLGLPQWLSGKESACNAGDKGDTGLIPGSGRSLQEEMAAHSSILAWRTPWTEEPLGSQRVKYDWAIEHITHMSLHFSSPLLLLIMEMGHLVTTTWLRYDWIWFCHIWYVLVYFTKKPRPRTITLRLRMPNSNQEARRDHKESFEMSIWLEKLFIK